MARPDDEKATALAALDANAGNILRTAREQGIPRKTLERWARTDDGPANGGLSRPVAEKVATLRQQYRDDLATAMETVAWRSVEAAVGKIDQASYLQLMTGASIAVDKMRLLRGESTAVIETRVAAMTPEQRSERLAELFATARREKETPGASVPVAN